MKLNAKILGISTLALFLTGATSLTAFAQVDETAAQPVQKTERNFDVKIYKPFHFESKEELMKELGVTNMEELKAKMEEQRQKIDQAIENNDYQAWSQAISENGKLSPFEGKITAENFSKFVEMHKHLKEAQKIAEELGLNTAPHQFKEKHFMAVPGVKTFKKVQ